MKHLTNAAVFCLCLGVATPGLADYKCGDDPYKLDDQTLTVTWNGPAPEGARFSLLDVKVGGELEGLSVANIQRGYGPFSEALEVSDIMEPKQFTDLDEFIAYQESQNVKMTERPTEVFKSYLADGNSLLSMQVVHPSVEGAANFAFCSIILQTALVVLQDDREDLLLRSYFHSRNEDGGAANFVPGQALHLAFETDAAWFPFRLSGLIDEEASDVMIDILSSKALDTKGFADSELGRALSLEDMGMMKGGGVEIGGVDIGSEELYRYRLTGALKAGADWPDLELAASK